LIKSDELLKKMDGILYQSFFKKSDYTLEALTKEIQRILREELRVPSMFHQQIEMAWLRKYSPKRF
jgi:hypothetical protein